MNKPSKQKIKPVKGIKNVGLSNELREVELGFVKTGTKAPKSITQVSQARLLARDIRRRLTHYLLVRCSVELLDKAIKTKTGKPHPRGAVSRSHAKGFNEGYQKAIKDYQDQWLT